MSVYFRKDNIGNYFQYINPESNKEYEKYYVKYAGKEYSCRLANYDKHDAEIAQKEEKVIKKKMKMPLLYKPSKNRKVNPDLVVIF